MKVLTRLRAEPLPTDQASRKEIIGVTPVYIRNTRNGKVAKNPLGSRGVDAVQVSSHRGPPTDRPPDRPDKGRSVFGGCSLERASTQSPVCQLASSLVLDHSLSGNATPLQKLQSKVWTPSYCQASPQAGSSQEFNRVLSWMHPTCGRYRLNEYLRRGTSQHQTQRCSMAQRDRVTRPHRVLDRHHLCHGLRAVSGCSREPSWGQTK
jgi:hypothetical protein